MRPLQQNSDGGQDFSLDIGYSSVIIVVVPSAPAQQNLLEGVSLALAIHQDALLARNVIEIKGY